MLNRFFNCITPQLHVREETREKYEENGSLTIEGIRLLYNLQRLTASFKSIVARCFFY